MLFIFIGSALLSAELIIANENLLRLQKENDGLRKELNNVQAKM